VLSWHHYSITQLPYLSPRLSAADDDDETESDVSVVKRDVIQVCLSSVTLCIMAKWCVLAQKLLLSAYRTSYIRN